MLADVRELQFDKLFTCDFFVLPFYFSRALTYHTIL